MVRMPPIKFIGFALSFCFIEGYEKRNMIVKTLKGSKDMIASTLNNFKEGTINCLLMNTIQMGAGLNITEATHVILLHSMTHEEEKQIFISS